MIGAAKILDKELRELFAPPFPGFWLILVPLCFVYVAGTIGDSQPKVRVLVQEAMEAKPTPAKVHELIAELSRLEPAQWTEGRQPTLLDLIRARADIGILWQGSWQVVIRPANGEERRRLLELTNTIALSIGFGRPVQVQFLQETDKESLREALDVHSRARVVDLGVTPERSEAYLAPRMIALSAAFLPFLLASGGLVRERENGALGPLLVAPWVGWGNLVRGKLTAYLLVSIIVLLFLIVAAVSLFDLSVGKCALAVFATQLLAMTASVLLGLAVSALARSELQAYLVAAVYAFCLIFLTGLLIPLEESPRLIQAVSVLFPLTFSLEPLEQWMLVGLPVWPYNWELLWLSLQVAVSGIAAVVGLKRFRERL